MSRIRMYPAGKGSTPGQQQTGDIGQVMPGISQQRQRSGTPAVKSLDDDDTNVVNII